MLGGKEEEEEDLILTSIFLYTSAKNKQQSDIFAFDMSNSCFDRTENVIVLVHDLEYARTYADKYFPSFDF